MDVLVWNINLFPLLPPFSTPALTNRNMQPRAHLRHRPRVPQRTRRAQPRRRIHSPPHRRGHRDFPNALGPQRSVRRKLAGRPDQAAELRSRRLLRFIHHARPARVFRAPGESARGGEEVEGGGEREEGGFTGRGELDGYSGRG